MSAAVHACPAGCHAQQLVPVRDAKGEPLIGRDGEPLTKLGAGPCKRAKESVHGGWTHYTPGDGCRLMERA